MLSVGRLNYSYSFHKKMLLLLGLWPSSYPRLQRLQISLVYLSYSVVITLQLAQICSSNCNFGCKTRTLASFLPSLMAIVRFMYSHIYRVTIQTLYTNVETDWEFFKYDKEGIKILREHLNKTRVHLISKIGFPCCALLCLQILIFVLLPPKEACDNCTGLWQFLVDDFKKNACNSVSFVVLVAIMNIFVILINETSILLVSEHVCGMLRVVGHHLRCAGNVNATLPLRERNSKICSNITYAVRIHVRARKLRNILWDSIGTSYMLICLGCIVSISLHMMNIVEDLTHTHNITTLVYSVVFVLYIYTYAANLTYFGQRLINFSVDVFDKAYNSQWYGIPVDAQKLYLFILQQSTYNSAFTLYGLITGSLEMLSKVIRTSLSYFAVLYSIQK